MDRERESGRKRDKNESMLEIQKVCGCLREKYKERKGERQTDRESDRKLERLREKLRVDVRTPFQYFQQCGDR